MGCYAMLLAGFFFLEKVLIFSVYHRYKLIWFCENPNAFSEFFLDCYLMVKINKNTSKGMLNLCMIFVYRAWIFWISLIFFNGIHNLFCTWFALFGPLWCFWWIDLRTVLQSNNCELWFDWNCCDWIHSDRIRTADIVCYKDVYWLIWYLNQRPFHIFLLRSHLCEIYHILKFIATFTQWC